MSWGPQGCQRSGQPWTCWFPAPRQAHPPLKQPTDLLSLSVHCWSSGDISRTLRVTELRARTPLCLTSTWQGPSVSLGGTCRLCELPQIQRDRPGSSPLTAPQSSPLLPAPPPTQGSDPPLFDGTVSPARTQTSVFLSVRALSGMEVLGPAQLLTCVGRRSGPQRAGPELSTSLRAGAHRCVPPTRDWA